MLLSPEKQILPPITSAGLAPVGSVLGHRGGQSGSEPLEQAEFGVSVASPCAIVYPKVALHH